MLNHPAEIPVYRRLPLRPVAGEGCWLIDHDGNRWLDLYGAHAVAVTGHRHPAVERAIVEQASRLLFYSNAVALEARERFLTALADLLPSHLDRIFLVSTGAEANEQAIALARRRTGRAEIVVVDGGFHGRTLATLCASGIEKYRRLAETSEAGRGLAAHTRVVPFDRAAEAGAAVTERTAAVLVEPVQGLAGARDCSVDFLRALRRSCDAAGALLLFDEVQTGCGRTGAFTAAQAVGVEPDVLTLAKGIASGMPIGALAARASVTEGISHGELGTTFGGGPIPCAAGVATLAVLKDERLPDRAVRLGARFRDGLASVPGVRRVQGRGLMLGVVLDRPSGSVRSSLLRERILVGSAEDEAVVRLLPPLVVGESELDRFIDALSRAVRDGH